MKKLLTHTLLLLLISCTKQTVIVSDTHIVSEKIGRVELHLAILKERVSKFSDHTIYRQDGYDNADSALIVNQFIHDNELVTNQNPPATAYDLMHDSYPYDSCFYSGGNFIIEVPVYIFYLSDTTGKAIQTRRWVSNGYAQFTKAEWNTHYDLLKVIFPNKN